MSITGRPHPLDPLTAAETVADVLRRARGGLPARG